MSETSALTELLDEARGKVRDGLRDGSITDGHQVAFADLAEHEVSDFVFRKAIAELDGYVGAADTIHGIPHAYQYAWYEAHQVFCIYMPYIPVYGIRR